MCRRLVALVLTGVVLVPRAAEAVSLAEEQKLGRRFALEAAGQLQTISDPAVVDLVRGVGKRLLTSLGTPMFDYHFRVVADPALNAFAVPGGQVYVFGGLIARVSSVDELASVVGHEIAHVHAHHIARLQERTQLWNYAALVGVLLSAVQPVLGVGAMAAAASARLKYTRELEEEADSVGLRFMNDAGYDVAAMPSFFKRILAEQRLNPAGVPPYLLTHPLTEDRIAKVETALATLRTRHPRSAERDLELEEARAVVRARLESPEIVLAEYQQRAEAAPEDGFTLYLVGIVHDAIGRLDAARATLERARTLGGAGHRLPARLGQIYLRLGRVEDARRELAAYVAAHEDDASAHGMLGRVLLELEDQEAAIAELERSLILDDALDESHWLLGQTYGRTSRSGEGFYHLAKAFELRGKLEQAVSQYGRARDALPRNDRRAEEIRLAMAELGEIVSRRERERQR